MMSYFWKNKNYILAGIVIAIAIVAIIFFIHNSLKQGPKRTAEVKGNNFDGGTTERVSNDKEQDAGDDANDQSQDHAGTRHNNLNGAPNIKGSEEEDNEKGQNEKLTDAVPLQDQSVDKKFTQMLLEQAETTLPAKNVALFPNTDTCDTTNPSSESNAADIEVLQNPKQNEIKGSKITDQPEAEIIPDDNIVKNDQATPLEKASPEVLASILNAQETYEYMVTPVQGEEAEIIKPSWVVPGMYHHFMKDLTSDLSEPDSFANNTSSGL